MLSPIFPVDVYLPFRVHVGRRGAILVTYFASALLHVSLCCEPALAASELLLHVSLLLLHVSLLLLHGNLC